MNELLTEKQKERRQRDATLAQTYSELCKKFPTASTSRIIAEMEKQSSLTKYGIRAALVRMNAI